MCEDYFNLILYEGIFQGVTPAVDTALAPWKAGGVQEATAPPLFWPPGRPGTNLQVLAAPAASPRVRVSLLPASCLLAPSSLHLAPASSQSPPGHLATWTPDVKVSTSLLLSPPLTCVEANRMEGI